MTQRFSKILVANRGEIACRVFRSARDHGFRTVAVYSDADADALHVSAADEAVRIGPSPASESYLSVDAILDAAQRSGAEAIHPGYGFLSENAAFAEACAQAGITFIGPSPEAIRLMGHKSEAKRRMEEAGVPCVPGYEGEAQDDATFQAEADRIGYPLLLKAAAGGGGRGMRRVDSADEVPGALAGARSEAKNAFGSDELLLEKLIEDARHVEIQVIADTDGACIHLGERDCSVQRRYQKIIEESPCPVMTPELRGAMGDAAVRAAKAVAYANAGTVEFLLDRDGNFYFLEMNTRLQVEHPVTEAVTGLDLVALQFRVARGEALGIRQDDVHFQGHAIEARIYAEDPAQNFAPQTGPVVDWMPPCHDAVRVDHGLRSGTAITPFYDPMVAKVIAHGANRTDAIERLDAALRDTVLFGPRTNIDLLRQILRDPAFAEGNATTAFMETSMVLPLEREAPSSERFAVVAAVLVEAAACDVPRTLRGWRSTGPATMPMRLEWEGETHDLSIAMTGTHYEVQEDEMTVAFEVNEVEYQTIHWSRDGYKTCARFSVADGVVYLHYDGRTDRFVDLTYVPPVETAEAAGGVLKAPMAGQIVRVDAADGDRVAKHQVLVVLEAMKIENQIIAPHDGVVASIAVSVGDHVDANQVLLSIDGDASV